MAGSNTYVLAGGAAYLAYNWWQSQQSVTSTGSTPPTIPASVLTPAALAAYIATQRTAGKTDAQIQAALTAMQVNEVACVAPSTWDTTNGICAAPQSTPATLASLLTTAAGNAAQFGLNVDQWLYYYNRLPGRTVVTGQQVDQMLAKAGIDRTSPQSVDYFVGMLNSVGLSGYTPSRGTRFIPVPRLMLGRGFGGYGISDFKRAHR